MSHFQGNTGTLIIIVGRAKGLPNKRKLEKQNPYCLLRIANLTDKTKADLRGGQTPRWDEEFRFNISPDVQPILKLSVLDETKKAPTLIAEAEIDFTPAFYSSVKDGYDKWHQLNTGVNESGEIYLEMTFYPASMNGFSSMKKSFGSSMSSSTSSNSPRRRPLRQLPPIPGHNMQGAEPEVDPNAIPPPLPRNPQSQPILDHDELRSSMIDFNKSHMSVHSLPDVPMHNNIKKELPPIRHEVTRSEFTEPHSIEDHCSPEMINDSQSEPSGPSLLDPGRHSPVSDLKAFAKKFTTKYNVPLFNKEIPDLTPSSDSTKPGVSNAFDQLEREVQSDLEQYPPVPKSSKKPPPVPSHSSGSFKLSGGSLPPVPTTTDYDDSITNYKVLEVGEHSRGRQSPPRKAPTSFYRSGNSSPTRIDLTSIPYDANTISSPSKTRPNIEHYEERPIHSKDDEVMLDRHSAPTPYDFFVKNANLQNSTSSLGSSGGRSRTSPTRFKSSLPPPPPPH